MFAWLLGVEYGTRLEDHGDRFWRLIGWPNTVAIVGGLWTMLLITSVVGAHREHGYARVGALAGTTVIAVIVTVLVPLWYVRLEPTGISTSEFLDGLFLLLGGILPGGQATIGLRLTCVMLLLLTLISAIPLAARAPQSSA